MRGEVAMLVEPSRAIGQLPARSPREVLTVVSNVNPDRQRCGPPRDQPF